MIFVIEEKDTERLFDRKIYWERIMTIIFVGDLVVRVVSRKRICVYNFYLKSVFNGV